MLEKTTALSRAAYLAPPYDYDELVQRDRVHQLIYTDPAIFTAEMTHIFGAVWVYLAHESQIPKNDDFITAKLGLRPIIVLRDSKGMIRALYNRCTHRGTTLCRLEKGNSNVFRCPYHGWTFNNDGTHPQRAVAGRLCQRRHRDALQCRADSASGNPIAASSSAPSTWMRRHSPNISAA